jgi:hypothetical protein
VDSKRLAAAAADLAATLREAADDDRLWLRSSSAVATPWEGKPERAEGCREALDIDWDPLVQRIAPGPPPPSALLTAELLQGVTKALDERGFAPVHETRLQLRELATTLESPALQLAQLRRAIRVSARLIIVRALARAPESMTAHLAFVLGLSAPLLLGRTRRSDLAELLSQGALRALVAILQRVAAEAAGGGDPNRADRAALAAVRDIDNAELGRQLADWRTVTLLEAPEPPADDKSAAAEKPLRQTSVADQSPAAKLRDRALPETRSLHVAVTSSLHRLWDDATGAPWATPEFDRLGQELAQALRAVRVELDRPDGPDAARLSTSLQRLEVSVLSTQVFVGRAVPHTPASGSPAGGAPA